MCIEDLNRYSLKMTEGIKQVLIGDGYLTSEQWNEVYGVLMKRKFIIPFPPNSNKELLLLG